VVDSRGRVRCEVPREVFKKADVDSGPRKEKIVMMEQSGYFATVSEEAVISYRLANCKEVGRSAPVGKRISSATPQQRTSECYIVPLY
jgi:hypothetical protein